METQTKKHTPTNMVKPPFNNTMRVEKSTSFLQQCSLPEISNTVFQGDMSLIRFRSC